MKKLFFALFIFVGLATKAQPKTITLTSNVTQLCKGSYVTFTANANFSASNYTWEVSHNDGASFTSIPNQYQSTCTTSSLLHNDKVRVKTVYEDEFAFPPSMPTEITSNQIQVQVNETKADINIISTATSGSIQFNGSNQYLTLSNSPNYGSAAFTIDGWFKLDASPTSNIVPIIGAEGYGNPSVLIQSNLNTVVIDVYQHHGDFFTVPAITIGAWHHLVVVRNSSSDFTVFLDGQRSSSGAITESYSFSSSANANVGIFQGKYFSGFLSNLRIVTGSALYDPTQTSITVPTSLTTAVTNTNLLLNAVNASSLLTDGSGTQTSITNNGSATWSGGTPFLVNLNSSSNATISNATVGGVWSSSNNSILEVNSSGGLTPIATGNATITYTVTSTTPFTCVSTESSLFSTTVCNNPTNGGTIASAQSGSNGFDPAAFTSSAAPTGHNGILEYKWQSSTTSSSAGFSDIASSNSDIYDAGALTQTTWFKRLARVDCSSDWSGAAESNVLQICITPSTPSVNVVNNCGTSTLSTTASGTLLWSTTATASSINVNSAGTYTVTQTVDGCISAAGSGVAAPLTIPSMPSVNVVNNCGTSTLSTTASGTLLWSTNETTTPITVTSAGTYTVTQTVNGCTSAAGSGVAAPKTLPTAGINNITGSTELTCNRTSINVTATGGVSYAWSGGLGSSDAATIPSAGTYTVTVTGANSCTSTAAITIVSIPLPATPTISANGATTFTYGNSVTLSAPAVGNALTLNGTSNYVSIPSNLNNSITGNNITIEGWFYITSTFNLTGLVTEALGSNNNVKFGITSDVVSGAQKIYAGFTNNGTSTTVTSSENLPLNKWTHIAATYDGASLKVYVNGTLTGTVANTSALPSGVDAWYFGKAASGSNLFPGTMDEIRIWNSARSQSDINANKNAIISPSTSGLKGYYKLDETSGTSAADATGSGYTGTVN
jgi:hypothetical protein